MYIYNRYINTSESHTRRKLGFKTWVHFCGGINVVQPPFNHLYNYKAALFHNMSMYMCPLQHQHSDHWLSIAKLPTIMSMEGT